MGCWSSMYCYLGYILPILLHQLKLSVFSEILCSYKLLTSYVSATGSTSKISWVGIRSEVGTLLTWVEKAFITIMLVVINSFEHYILQKSIACFVSLTWCPHIPTERSWTARIFISNSEYEHGWVYCTCPQTKCFTYLAAHCLLTS